MEFFQGPIIDIFHDEKRKSYLLNIDSAGLYSSIDNSTIKYSRIRSIEIKISKKDKNLTIEKLKQWKDNRTILGFSLTDNNKPICAYDGKDIHPLTQQSVVPLSFFNNNFLKGHEHITKWMWIALIFSSLSGIISGNIYNPQFLEFSFKFVTLFGIGGLLLNIGSYVSFKTIKQNIKNRYEPSIFNNHETSNSIHDVFNRRLLPHKDNISTNDILSAINESNLNATHKILLQDEFSKNKNLNYDQILKIKRKYFHNINKSR